MARRTKAQIAERLMARKIEDLLYALERRESRGGYARNTFSAARTHPGYTAIIRKSVGQFVNSNRIYFINNETGNIHHAVASYSSSTGFPGNDMGVSIDDEIARVTASYE